MGVLSDYFHAKPGDLDAIGDGGAPPKEWKRVEAKGFGVGPLEKLGKRLAQKALEGGEPPKHAEDFSWLVMALTPQMTRALAALDDPALEDHATAVASTRALLGELRELAREAEKSGDAMFLWTCV